MTCGAETVTDVHILTYLVFTQGAILDHLIGHINRFCVLLHYNNAINRSKRSCAVVYSIPLPPPQYGDKEVDGYDNGEDECDGRGEALLLCEGGARAIWVVGLCVAHMLCGQDQRNKKGKNHSPQAETEPHQPSWCHHDEQNDGRPQVGGSWRGEQGRVYLDSSRLKFQNLNSVRIQIQMPFLTCARLQLAFQQKIKNPLTQSIVELHTRTLH